VYPALEGAGSAAAPRGGIVVGKIRSAHQNQSLALLWRQFSERGAEFGKLDARGLFRLAVERSCIMTVGIFDLALPPAILIAKPVAQDGHEPCREIGARLK
jgi:hypothetical protein